MTLHRVEYSYHLPEWGSMEIDMDPAIDLSEKEALALAEIKEVYDDIENIEISEVKEIG
jgi:hypothetical protein